MPKTRHEPVRTCVGCRQEGDRRSLIRLVRGGDGEVRLDLTGRAPGRGAYLHSDPACFEMARKRRILERALKAAVPAELWGSLLDR